MKKGWEYKKLGEVCRKSNNIKWDDVPNDASYRYIDLTSVDRSDLCIHNPQYIKKDNAPSRAKQIIKAGDIIFATTRPTLRRVSLIDEKYDGDICSTGFCVLRPNVDVKSKLIFYALLEDGFYKYIEPLQTGANYPAVTDNIVKNYIIPIPPLSEQQSIVDYLDSAFAKIDAMKANAGKALNEAKALFQASLKEMLEPKEGWEEKKLGDVIEHLRTGLNPRTHFKLNTPDAEGFYITVRELKGFTIEPDEKTDKVNRAAIKRINERSNLKIGDVLFSGTGTIGKTALVSELPEKWNIKEGVYAMTPKHSELDSKYFIYYIGSEFFLRLVNDKAAGTGVRSIPMKELVKLPISIPPLTEQHSIATTLDSLKSKVDRLQANYEKISQECDALKQAILRQVFE